MSMKLALGPMLYYWERDRVLDFYAQAAGWPVDIVYLGEVVCSKRRALRPDDWLALAEQLAQAGKEVVLSTLALVEAESELGALRRAVGNGRFPIEANDTAALNMLSAAGGTRFIAGPYLNVYNGETLELLHELGACRWVLPVELSRDMLAALQARRPDGMETEVQVFGRLPLALSARCFTARAHHLPKDECEFRCRDYPDGLALATREGARFLTINGIQTQSGGSANLAGALPEMHTLGVDVARLSPQSQDMDKVVRLFRAAVDGNLAAAETENRIQTHLPDGACNGYWHGEPGMAWQPALPAD
jgi:collagenase-like PrtC family protease